MPATFEEKAAHVQRLISGAIMPDTEPTWADGTTPTDKEWHDISVLLLYEAELRIEQRPAAKMARRRANKLLRSFLSKKQRDQLRTSRYFNVRTPSGAWYRFCPVTGHAGQLKRHGKRLYEHVGLCLHGDEKLPPADVTLAQFLLLSSDEDEFLRLANKTPRKLWDGDWRRRLNQLARERAAAAEFHYQAEGVAA